LNNLEGLVVDVEITDFPTANRPARGRVIEVLGDPDAFGVDVEMMIRKHHLPTFFPRRPRRGAPSRPLDPKPPPGAAIFASFPSSPSMAKPPRTSTTPFSSTEPPTARGSCRCTSPTSPNTCPGTALDLEARLRGNSVYFPDRAIPMLPQELSTDICSLRPNEDRLVLSCLMRIDPQGEVLDYEICEGVIRSARRMTYTQVAAIIEAATSKHPRPLCAPRSLSFERMKTSRACSTEAPTPRLDRLRPPRAGHRVRRIRRHAHPSPAPTRKLGATASSRSSCWPPTSASPPGSSSSASPSLYRIHEMPEPNA
jgi:hypothetical protein